MSAAMHRLANGFTVAVDPVAAQLVAIDVRDTGVGIPPEALPRIFGAFEQEATGDGHGAPGLGLGLAIAEGLVQAQQWLDGHRAEAGPMLTSGGYLPQPEPTVTKVFTRAPIVRIVYSAIKDLLEAFVGNKGWGAYTAACNFQDAFALHLRQEAAWPVHVVNWGFWEGNDRGDPELLRAKGYAAGKPTHVQTAAAGNVMKNSVPAPAVLSTRTSWWLKWKLQRPRASTRSSTRPGRSRAGRQRTTRRRTAGTPAADSG